MFINQAKALLEYYFRITIKYKFRELIWPLVVVPLSWILDIIFRSEYIEKVLFYDKIVPYLYILFVGIALLELFYWVAGGIFYNMIPWDQESINHFLIYNKAAWIFAELIYALVYSILKVFPIYIALKTFYNLSLRFLIISILAMLIFIPFSVGLALILSYFIFKYRKDAEPFWWSTSSIASSIFPVSFSLMIFPKNIREILEIIFPPFGIIEEFRKIMILGYYSQRILLLSIFASIIYLLLGILIFYCSYNKAKRSGIIFLR